MATGDCQVLIYEIDLSLRSCKLIGKNKVNTNFMSSIEICPLGDYVVMATQNQYSKPDKVLCWRLNQSGQLVLPLMVDLQKTISSKHLNFVFGEIKIGYIAEQPLFVLNQSFSPSVQIIFTTNGQRLIGTTQVIDLTKSVVLKSVFSLGYLWMIDE